MCQRQQRYRASVAQRLPGGSLVIVCAALALLLAGCGTMSLSYEKKAVAAVPPPPLRHSLVFIIHGDADYIYHDTNGRTRRADLRTLRAATMVARRLTDSEVFIFHQRPSRKLLYFIPLPDGDFHHYHRGALQARVPYWRSSGPSRFEAETALYEHNARAGGAERARFFLYFGHEISEFDGRGYDASSPEHAFNVRDMATGLKGFTGDSTRFDLLVLSTCFGGTPHTIASLAPYARTIVASPDNLHLSYFDLRAFGKLDVFSETDDVPGFSSYFARQAFERLSANVQTAVTVAVYEPERAKAYLAAADDSYTRQLDSLKQLASVSIEYVDCAEEQMYVLPGMRDGVSVLFRPSRFGRAKHKLQHSGWQCCRPVTR